MTTAIRRKRLITSLSLVAVAILLVCGAGWWIAETMWIGTLRHALNHRGPESFSVAVTAACRNVNNGRMYVGKEDPEYVPDPYARSSRVYRYVVMARQALDDSGCLATIARAAREQNHSIVVAFAGTQPQVVLTFFRD